MHLHMSLVKLLQNNAMQHSEPFCSVRHGYLNPNHYMQVYASRWGVSCNHSISFLLENLILYGRWWTVMTSPWRNRIYDRSCILSIPFRNLSFGIPMPSRRVRSQCWAFQFKPISVDCQQLHVVGSLFCRRLAWCWQSLATLCAGFASTPMVPINLQGRHFMANSQMKRHIRLKMCLSLESYSTKRWSATFPGSRSRSAAQGQGVLWFLESQDAVPWLCDLLDAFILFHNISLPFLGLKIRDRNCIGTDFETKKHKSICVFICIPWISMVIL